MKKLILIPIFILLLTSLVLAEVTRTSPSANVVKYESNEVTSIDRMYWAVKETIPASCSINIDSCTSSIGGCTSAEQVWINIANNEIRLVVTTPELPRSPASWIELTLSGQGQCILNDALYVESRSDGTIDTEPTPIISEEVPLDFSGEPSTTTTIEVTTTTSDGTTTTSDGTTTTSDGTTTTSETTTTTIVISGTTECQFWEKEETTGCVLADWVIPGTLVLLFVLWGMNQ